MSLCDRCPGAGKCLLNYMGTACKNWRKREAPEVKATMEDIVRISSNEELARLFCQADFCEFCDYTKENGICRYIEENPSGRLFDGCVQAAKKWLQNPME